LARPLLFLKSKDKKEKFFRQEGKMGAKTKRESMKIVPPGKKK
jgi:hypothetical protein